MVYMLGIGELNEKIRVRNERAAALKATSQRLNADMRAAEAAKEHRLRQAAKVVELPALQVEFDKQAARIFPLISDEMWADQAAVVEFPRSSWRQFRAPKYPVIQLGTASGDDNLRFQVYHVYCRADRKLLIRELFSCRNEYIMSLGGVFDIGGKEDCEIILNFLRNYKP